MNKAITTKVKKEIVFAGAQSLLGAPKDRQEEQNRKVIITVSRALGITPFGVNILGGLPYTNNIGRKEKMAMYDKSAKFEYRWVKRSEKDDDKAICECRVIVKKAEKEVLVCDWVVGECSPKTIKMGPLQGYQNHMAQTRAENRAFEAAFGNRMRLELFSNIQRMFNTGKVDEGQASKALNAGKTSAEEMTENGRREVPPVDGGKPKDYFATAKKLIETTNDKQELANLAKRLDKYDGFTFAQKHQLSKLINEKIIAK